MRQKADTTKPSSAHVVKDVRGRRDGIVPLRKRFAFAKPKGGYIWVEVETYRPAKTGGKFGSILVRPVAGEGYDNMMVQCSRKVLRNCPAGRLFRIFVTPIDKNGITYLIPDRCYGFVWIEADNHRISERAAFG
jgi:hypothetical protein